MFTPELVNREKGTFVLVANHCVENDKAVELSIAFNLARLRYASEHLPPDIDKCILTYDFRGQRVSEANVKRIEAAFAHVYKLEVLL